MAGKKNIVWVLGAGFSKPLGGPLLPQLFTEEAQRQARAVFPEPDYGFWTMVIAAIPAFYRQHKRTDGNAGFWGDAEQFLDLLDSAADTLAARDSGLGHLPQPIIMHLVQQTFSRLTKSTELPALLSEVRDEAKRLLVAECSAFLVELGVKSERWEPFRRWSVEHVKPGRLRQGREASPVGRLRQGQALCSVFKSSIQLLHEERIAGRGFARVRPCVQCSSRTISVGLRNDLNAE